MKDKIICLIGESGSGKSTIAQLLRARGFNYIESYTTRTPRYANEKGHIFVDIAEMNRHELDGTIKIIAKNNYNGNYYWALNTQYKNKGISIYVIDPVGIDALRKEAPDAEIYGLYLKTDKAIRFERLINRAQAFGAIKKEALEAEVFNRITYDDIAFKVVSCNYVVDANRSANKVLEDILNIMLKEKL